MGFPRTFSALLNGCMWTIRTSRSITHCGEKKGGLCCDRLKEIKILSGVTPKDRLRLLIHEGLHAQGFELLSEEWVDRVSIELADLVIEGCDLFKEEK